MANSPASPTRCLILACGNTLREDDGVGPWLAAWAQVRFADEPRIQVITRHQWTPELAQDVVEADAVLFVDCSVHGIPGEVQLVPIQSAQGKQSLFATHHLAPSELLAMSQELYGKQPRRSLLLTLGAFSIELREGFSKTIEAALPLACAKLEKTVLEMLASDF